jgi:hypothetical protein
MRLKGSNKQERKGIKISRKGEKDPSLPLSSPQGSGSPTPPPRLAAPPPPSVSVAGERHAAFLPHTRREAPPARLPHPTLHSGRRLFSTPAARWNQRAARAEASQ